MSVKIILSKASEPAEKRELLLNDDIISVGRDPTNVLPLPGTQISKFHARIERQGSDYFIVDLNSTNCTFVNGEKLTPASQHQLHQGDKVSIADYELGISQFGTVASPAAPPGHEPLPDSRNSFSSIPTDDGPPSSAIATSSEILHQWSRLAAEIQLTLEKFDIQELVRNREELQARCDALEEENRRLKAEQGQIVGTKETSPAIPVEPLQAGNSRLEQISQVLLPFFFKLSLGRSSFLSEFIVRTVIRTTNDLPFQPRSDAEILHYFADSNLSEREFAERLVLLKKEADQIVLHMIGLLEGYRRSVDEGTRRILQRVDPDRLEEELPDTLLLRYLPPLADLKLFSVVRKRLRDLIQEDRGVLEKQVFRPGFARAYVECVEPSSTNV
jgi:pSer/pThr/pTyr-binding forkhead associated (FHA) protein